MLFRIRENEVERIEKRLEEINEESSGEAARDHKRYLELYEEKEDLESKLLELYEFLEECLEF